MKLITHNLLICNKKGCVVNNFPLRIRASATEQRETEYNEKFIKHMLVKLDWPAIVQASKDLNFQVPETLPEEKDEAFYRILHSVLNELHIIEGILVCPNCNREYPIDKGIPNMLLSEEEV